MKGRVMIVDDEKEIADLVEIYLKNDGFETEKFYNGTEVLKRMEEENPDLILLDVMLPDMDGFAICRKIREKYNFPVIMLTAKDQDLDKITGLTMGADDYITKPFHPLELLARVKAQMRRYTTYNQLETEPKGNVIAFSGLVINQDDYSCMLNEKEVSLTPTEFAILWHLCSNRGKVVSSEELFREVWGEKYYTNSNNTVMVHIRHLREKMHDSVECPKYIKTVWGVGYRIDE
ncbi:VanR-ABDEGLN family response regulator transcription factor [Anaerolentibacter hominis]|uniref:VanR-ABDEGLN family response regulator transcription factor n=1 Tax=Anaerolentibacter hominis TaxID=3079009 RepID=UPI0031B8AC4F